MRRGRRKRCSAGLASLSFVIAFPRIIIISYSFHAVFDCRLAHWGSWSKRCLSQVGHGWSTCRGIITPSPLYAGAEHQMVKFCSKSWRSVPGYRAKTIIDEIFIYLSPSPPPPLSFSLSLLVGHVLETFSLTRNETKRNKRNKYRNHVSRTLRHHPHSRGI